MTFRQNVKSFTNLQKTLAFFLHILYNSLIAMRRRCRNITALSGADRRTAMSEERNEFTPDLFTLEDEDGNEKVFELLDVMEYQDDTYYALMPYYGEDEDALAEDDGEFVILKSENIDGEDMLVSIEEDEEFEKIGNLFLERLNEIYDDEEEEEEDEE